MTTVPQGAIGVDRLRELALSESGFIFDPRTGQSFSANDSALECLRLLQEGLSDREIAQRLGLVFDRPAELIEPAVAAFRRQVGRYVQ